MDSAVSRVTRAPLVSAASAAPTQSAVRSSAHEGRTRGSSSGAIAGGAYGRGWVRAGWAPIGAAQYVHSPDERSIVAFDTRGVLQVVDADGVRLVTFDRPDALNAFDQRLWYATADVLHDAVRDDDLRCVVLTGNGRGFSA